MAQLKRTARSRAVPRVGYARRGVIHTVPDDMVEELLKSGEWDRVGEPSGASEPKKSGTSTGHADAPDEALERLTEPAPSKPAKSTSKTKKKRR